VLKTPNQKDIRICFHHFRAIYKVIYTKDDTERIERKAYQATLNYDITPSEK
jgi:hypothetical protein